MVIDSLNLKLGQITRFSSNMILDKMSSAKCHLLFGLSKERPMVIDSLNFNLSQISSLMHIYGVVDFNRYVD